MTGNLFARLKALVSARRQALPPAPRAAITELKPFNAEDTPPSVPATHPDMALVMEHWRAHARHNPGMTVEKFLEVLEGRERFFREERLERQAKLRSLNASIKPLP